MRMVALRFKIEKSRTNRRGKGMAEGGMRVSSRGQFLRKRTTLTRESRSNGEVGRLPAAWEPGSLPGLSFEKSFGAPINQPPLEPK
jgi:hypothetical protein